jgi:hypothetical protein
VPDESGRVPGGTFTSPNRLSNAAAAYSEIVRLGVAPGGERAEVVRDAAISGLARYDRIGSILLESINAPYVFDAIGRDPKLERAFTNAFLGSLSGVASWLSDPRCRLKDECMEICTDLVSRAPELETTQQLLDFAERRIAEVRANPDLSLAPLDRLLTRLDEAILDGDAVGDYGTGQAQQRARAQLRRIDELLQASGRVRSN